MPDDNTTDNPFTQLQQGVAAMHEVFISAMEAGFTEQQAMTIVVQLLAMAQTQGA